MGYKIKPWAHQLKAIENARGKDCYALFFEQGCGKTSTLINILVEKYQELNSGLPVSTLILCPQIVIENWKREFEAYSDIDPIFIHTLTGSARNRTNAISQVFEGNENHVFITNYEALNMETLYAAFRLWKPKIVVLDESHKCKDLTSKRTKAAIKLSDTAKHRYILSGTPVVNSPMDIFSQFLFLDHGEEFGANFFSFRAEYFVDLNAKRARQSYFPNWVIKPGALQEINKHIYKKAMRVRKSEAIDLPPFVRQVVEFALEGNQRKAYEDMERDMVAEVNGFQVTADLAIKKALRMQQISAGFVTDDEKVIRTFIPNPRNKALGEVVQSLGKNKFIVWAVFKQNYADIRSVLEKNGILYREVHGDISAAQKQENIDLFNSPRETVQALIAHPASAGIGCNLTAAPYAVFYTRSFNWGDDEQAEARNYRGGSHIHEKVTRIDIIASDTIDGHIREALAKKQNISETILKYVKGKP